MSKIDSSEVVLQEEEKKKNKLFTAYRIPMVGGSYFYGVASSDGGTITPDGGGVGGGE